ncbi:pyridoxamine 5'-phosphate oxidase family protein [Enterococcus timonensis]|uniref:pyridoxamine 5'-phosphate oxidase family protein n=1 Tax=Enterococcus timonensis TaxID=1852364 RepID=UPI0008DA1265|nr:pyridoxamine 5'-phosphate oxidase family protein [Enterococcus timonensis]
MFTQTFLDVLKYEGVVTLITEANDGFHLANTWNSYIRVADNQEDTLYIPAAGMHAIEKDINQNPEVLMVIGAREVTGLIGPGTGFHLTAEASFLDDGKIYDQMHTEFPFLTRVLVLTGKKLAQKI